MTSQKVTSGTRQRSSPSAIDWSGDDDAVLRAAVARATIAWREESEGVSAQDASDLADAIIAAVINHPSSGSSDQRLRSTAGGRLLELVTREVIRTWREIADPPPPGEILRNLEAIESVRAASEPDAADDFVNRLRGMDGLELLVEVSHDLRSPLTSILFLAETLQRRLSGDLNELQHRQVGLIYSAALGLSELASSVIEVSRGGNRLAKGERTPFSVTDILQSVMDITLPMAEEKGLFIRINPPPIDHRLGFPLALSRVLLNLTTNALKFTERGFVEIVAREVDPTRIEFSVRDTGRGIEREPLDTLFSSFRPAPDDRKAAFSSTGLGLALSRRLVEAMGSDLLFETKPKWGTRFYFELDLQPLSHQPASTCGPTCGCFACASLKNT